MAEVVLLRHGESTWNRENRFTGWAVHHSSPLPRTECLKDTVARFLPDWHSAIVPQGQSHRYLADPQAIAAAMQQVAGQGKAAR
jgi:bisphosphoglycerate-dependent phosphoglycerate mutase